MFKETVKIIINKIFNKSVLKPINFHLEYDLDYIINKFIQFRYYNYNQIVKIIK